MLAKVMTIVRTTKKLSDTGFISRFTLPLRKVLLKRGAYEVGYLSMQQKAHQEPQQ